MTCTAVAIILSVAGATLELGGLAVVAREIRRDKGHAARIFSPRPPARRPPRTYPGPQSPRRPLMSGVTTSADREALPRLEASIGNAIIALKRHFDTELDQSAEQLRTEAATADEDLRKNLRELLAGDLRERAIGAGLIGAGIVLSMTGSIVGTLN